LLKALFVPPAIAKQYLPDMDYKDIAPTERMMGLLRAHDPTGAAREATRRLRVLGFEVPWEPPALHGALGQRLAASLVIPLDRAAWRSLLEPLHPKLETLLESPETTEEGHA
jgi:CRISPR-associated protein Csx17